MRWRLGAIRRKSATCRLGPRGSPGTASLPLQHECRRSSRTIRAAGAPCGVGRDLAKGANGMFRERVGRNAFSRCLERRRTPRLGHQTCEHRLVLPVALARCRDAFRGWRRGGTGSCQVDRRVDDDQRVDFVGVQGGRNSVAVLFGARRGHHVDRIVRRSRQEAGTPRAAVGSSQQTRERQDPPLRTRPLREFPGRRRS